MLLGLSSLVGLSCPNDTLWGISLISLTGGRWLFWLLSGLGADLSADWAFGVVLTVVGAVGWLFCCGVVFDAEIF